MGDSTGQRPVQRDRIELQTNEDARDQRWRKYLERAVQREPQALADLYDESSRLIFSIASRILGNPADAEEITLDVYTYVWRSAAQFDSSRASVATWLIMLTRSRAIDRLRSQTSRTDQSGTNPAGNLLATPVASSNHDSHSSRMFVVSALQQLEPADRQLLDLAFYSGLSHSELATKLETPLGTVKSRMRAALGRLRKLLGGADVAS
jgi:RNA polymerase sigma-70 factor (ECF subfamily)